MLGGISEGKVEHKEAHTIAILRTVHSTQGENGGAYLSCFLSHSLPERHTFYSLGVYYIHRVFLESPSQ